MKKYTILDKEMYNFISHDRFLCDHYRWNLNKTQFIVKYVGNQPTFLSGYKEYTNVEIINYLKENRQTWFLDDI
jgi:hypothetical protein